MNLLEHSIKQGFQVPERLGLAAYCDKYRIIPPGKPESGKWRTSRVEPWRYVYEVYDRPDVRSVTVKGASQTSKSETQTNIICHTMDVIRRPILVVKSSGNNVDSYVADYLDTTISAMPSLRAAVRDMVGKDKKDAIRHKRFHDEWMYIGSPTRNTLCERAAGIGLADEISTWKHDIEGEGDGYYLLKKRLANYWDSKLIAVSKPSIFGSCVVSKLYDEQKRHVWLWKCPESRTGEDKTGCGDLFELDFTEQMGCVDHNPRTAYLECPHCGYQIPESRRLEASYSGKFHCLDPDRPWTDVSFHMSGIMFPWVSFASAMDDYLKARGDHSRLKTFYNQILGLAFDPRIQSKTSPIELRENNSVRYRSDIPEDGKYLTCGVDIQEKEGVLTWLCWTDEFKAYSIFAERFGGSPKKDSFWYELDRRLEREFRHERGMRLKAEGIVVDTGYSTLEVYRFLKSHEYSDRVFAGYKGDPGWEKPLFKVMKGHVGHGQTLDNIFKFSSWNLQLELYQKIRDKEILFPAEFKSVLLVGEKPFLSDGYFKELTAYDLLESPLKSGGVTRKWTAGKRKRDYNDCNKMQLGLIKMLNPAWESIEMDLSWLEKKAKGELKEEEEEEIESDPMQDAMDEWMESATSLRGCF